MKYKKILAACLLVAASTGIAQPAFAAEQDNQPQETVMSIDGTATRSDGRTLLAGSYKVDCKVTAMNPHVSSGAKLKGDTYVIYKTGVACTGIGSYPAEVTVRVKGALWVDPADYPGDSRGGTTFGLVAESTETRSVPVTGKQQIFYTPQTGGGRVRGYYHGNSNIQIIAPKASDVRVSYSKDVFCNPAPAVAKCS